MIVGVVIVLVVAAVMVPSPKTQVGLSVASGSIANLLVLFLTSSPLRTDMSIPYPTPCLGPSFSTLLSPGLCWEVDPCWLSSRSPEGRRREVLEYLHPQLPPPPLVPQQWQLLAGGPLPGSQLSGLF